MNPLALVSGLSPAVVKLAVVALAIAGLLLATYSHGRRVAEGDIAAAQRDIAIAYAGEIVARQDEADRLLGENTALRALREANARVITKEVTRYVQVTPPAQRAVLPGTWRLRHDLAARGQAPSAEAGSLDAAAAGPVDDAAALDTVSRNYAACLDAIAQVEAWQRRYQVLEDPR